MRPDDCQAEAEFGPEQLHRRPGSCIPARLRDDAA